MPQAHSAICKRECYHVRHQKYTDGGGNYSLLVLGDLRSNTPLQMILKLTASFCLLCFECKKKNHKIKEKSEIPPRYV